MIFTTILGAIAGSVVGALKILLGRSLTQTALAVGVASAAVGASLLVHSDGVDFRLLEPLWLTVGLFVFFPGAWGITAVLLMDRLSRPDGLHGANQSLLDAPIGKRIGPAVGWAVLLLLTGIGVWGLVGDISQLT